LAFLSSLLASYQHGHFFYSFRICSFGSQTWYRNEG